MQLIRPGYLWDPLTRCHGTAELWNIVQFAAESRFDVEARLIGGPVCREALSSNATLISFADQLAAQRVLALPSQDWASRAAARLHPTSFGLAGLGLLCSASVEAALRFCARFARLFALKHVWDVRVESEMAVLAFQPGYALATLGASDYETHELIKALTLLRDITAGGFAPRAVHLAGGSTARTICELSNLCGCTVVPDATSSRIEFAADILRTPLPQHEPRTHASCLEACESQLRRLTSFNRIAGRVRAKLAATLHAMPSIDEVARSLCLSARSLRRRLDAEGTSFQLLAEEVRKEAAERLLGTTRLSTEAIADALGYGDVANFRHAFKRWKGETPRRYRDRAQSSSVIELGAGAVSLRAPRPRLTHTLNAHPLAPRAAMGAP
ncbi:MAG: helix-turn-helix domain-containing protein [Proteobacteria bacterium]|nr:helix-turn-helix domain-containing protein [Pseudomonadota bacterium]